MYASTRISYALYTSSFKCVILTPCNGLHVRTCNYKHDRTTLSAPACDTSTHKLLTRQSKFAKINPYTDPTPHAIFPLVLSHHLETECYNEQPNPMTSTIISFYANDSSATPRGPRPMALESRVRWDGFELQTCCISLRLMLFALYRGFWVCEVCFR